MADRRWERDVVRINAKQGGRVRRERRGCIERSMRTVILLERRGRRRRPTRWISSAAYVVNPIALRHHGYSAGSFRDMTRVAKLNPGMWTELFSDNRDNLIEAVKMIEDALREYRLALESDDKDRLFALLDRANRTKEAVEADAKRKKQEAIYDND